MYRLETERLRIRSLTKADLIAIQRILDFELSGSEDEPGLGARKRWLDWTILGYEQFAVLHQPPFGERGVVLKKTEGLIGLCGFTPCMDRYEQLPGFAPEGEIRPTNWTTTEIGLYYAISPAYQGRGFASEAARALLDYGFGDLRLKRIIATTTYDNLASQSVMRKLGMNIRSNTYAEPEWLQIVGVLENPGLQGEHLG